MPSLGPLEILIILVVAVLVFPPHKLPEIARQAGRAISTLRRLQGTLTADLERLVEQPDEPPTLPPKSTSSRDPDSSSPSDEQASGPATD